MDPTTLVTFLYKAPPDVKTVELLGSWDNFQLPYRMYHDSRRGIGFYSGCFSFENIVFDGDVQMQWTKPRSGGLKQGGTYWYYYRLNYDFDAYDDRRPHTTGCPLLPGQEVNIIDVPSEILELPSRCHSAYGDIIGSLTDMGTKQTMDPAQKFANLSPPPISRVHVRCLSDDALSGRLEGRNVIHLADLDSPVPTADSTFERPVSRGNHFSQIQKLGEMSRIPSSSPRRPPALDEAEHIVPATDRGGALEATSEFGMPQPLPDPHSAFTGYTFSGYPTVLPTLEEDVAPDDIQSRFLDDREWRNPPSPLPPHDRRPSETSPLSSPGLSPIHDFPSSVSHPPDETLDSNAPRPRLYSFANTDFPSSSPPSPTYQSSLPSPESSNHPTPPYCHPPFAFPSSTSTTTLPSPAVAAHEVNPQTIHTISARLRHLDESAIIDDDPSPSSPLGTPPHSRVPSFPTPILPPLLLLSPAAVRIGHESNRNSGAEIWDRDDTIPAPPREISRTTSTPHLWTYSLPRDLTDSTHSLAAKTRSSAVPSRGDGVLSGSTMGLTTKDGGEGGGAPRLELFGIWDGGSRLSLGLRDWRRQSRLTLTEDWGEGDERGEGGGRERGEEELGEGIVEGAEGEGGGGSGGGRGMGEEELSIAEAIWSELGYLGDSIA